MSWGVSSWGVEDFGEETADISTGEVWGAFIWGLGIWGGDTLTTGTISAGTNKSTAAKALQESILGRDIQFENDYSVDNKGDYTLLVGLPALRQAILARLMVNPGEFKTRPSYGAGVRQFVKKPKTTTNLSRLRERIETQLSRESRIEEIIEVALESNESTITVGVAVRTSGRALKLSPFVFDEFGEVL